MNWRNQSPKWSGINNSDQDEFQRSNNRPAEAVWPGQLPSLLVPGGALRVLWGEALLCFTCWWITPCPRSLPASCWWSSGWFTTRPRRTVWKQSAGLCSRTGSLSPPSSRCTPSCSSSCSWPTSGLFSTHGGRQPLRSPPGSSSPTRHSGWSSVSLINIQLTK